MKSITDSISTQTEGAGASLQPDSLRIKTSEGLPVPPAIPDSLALSRLNPEPVYAMAIDNPYYLDPTVPAAETQDTGMSWVFLIAGLLFSAVALKFHNNYRYLKALVDNLTDVKVRQNVFDETVKETSFIFLLNLLWIVCAGIVLREVLNITGVPDISDAGGYGEALTIGVCTIMSGLYLAGIMTGYWMIGRVFTDKVRTRMWIKGAAASTGLETVLLLPLAILTLCYRPWLFYLLPIAGGVFIIGKIIFIYKGFRIFFTQISSWMLFLYYLCSLEIVPLVLTYLITARVCGMI